MVIMQAWRAEGCGTVRAPDGDGPGPAHPEVPEQLGAPRSTWWGRAPPPPPQGSRETHQVEQGKCVIYFPNDLEQSKPLKATGKAHCPQMHSRGHHRRLPRARVSHTD